MATVFMPVFFFFLLLLCLCVFWRWCCVVSSRGHLCLSLMFERLSFNLYSLSSSHSPHLFSLSLSISFLFFLNSDFLFLSFPIFSLFPSLSFFHFLFSFSLCSLLALNSKFVFFFRRSLLLLLNGHRSVTNTHL